MNLNSELDHLYYRLKEILIKDNPYKKKGTNI